MSVDAVPSGGGVESAISFITTPGAMARSAKAAQVWVADAITAVRMAAEPNPWKAATDEEIAGEILRRVEEHKRLRF